MLQALGSQISLLLKRTSVAATAIPVADARLDGTSSLTAANSAMTTATTSSCHQLSNPQRFDSESGYVRLFLTQCELHFELQAPVFPSDRSKIAYIISHLTGRAEAWATAEWSRRSPSCSSLEGFVTALEWVFQHTTSGREASWTLMKVRQGKRRVSDYAIDFRTLAIQSDWNNSALADVFFQGLSNRVKDQLIATDLPEDLDELIALSIKVVKRIHECNQDRERYSPEWKQPSGNRCLPPQTSSSDRRGRGPRGAYAAGTHQSISGRMSA